jgi:formamidopyrimidine-DNA glycosylase
VPELPDVESYRRFFDRHATGRRVERAESDPTVVRNTTPEALDRALAGRTFAEPGRHGKWLIGWTDGPTLLLHFGMTGELVWSADEPERHRHDRLTLTFAGGGELRYRNLRKLGGIWLAHDASEVEALLGPLGPDALGLSKRAFLERLAGRRGQVKAALMDQTFVAGIGNLLADEILWQARLHPKRRIEALSDAERTALQRATARVVRDSVEHFDYVATRRTWLSHVRGRPGARCPRCGTPLARTVAAGRTTYFCPNCQPGP